LQQYIPVIIVTRSHLHIYNMLGNVARQFLALWAIVC